MSLMMLDVWFVPKDVVFKSPMFSCFIYQAGEEFSRNDFPRVSVTLLDHVAVVIADCAFTKVVEHSVITCKVYGDGVHQVRVGNRALARLSQTGRLEFWYSLRFVTCVLH